MVNVTLRSSLNAALSHTQMDANLTALKDAVELCPSNTFNITVALDDEQGVYKYKFNGHGTDNDLQPTLYLFKGNIYHFNVSTTGHPFYITLQQQASASTVVANAWTDGVTNNGATTGVVKMEVMMDFPSTLHYHCSLHTHMNGEIKIIGV